MKKFKLELFVTSIFFAFLSLLLSERLNVIYENLSVILATFFFVVAIAIELFIKSGGKHSKEGYAPKYLSQSIISGIFAIAIIIGIAVLFNKPRFSTSFDLTKNKVNSLSEETLTFLSSLEKDIEIFCIPAPSPTENYCDASRDLLQLYARKTPHIINNAELDLRDQALIEKIQPSGFARLVLMTSDNKSELSGQITESKLTNAILNLIKFKKTVYFLTGHGEPTLTYASERNYTSIAEDLKAKAYQTMEWDSRDGDLPADAQLLVAGDNQLAYDKNVEGILRRFVARGGKLILIHNPYREQGLTNFYSDIGLEMPPTLLMLNQNTPIGKEIAAQSPTRPPVVVSNFNMYSSITKVIAQSMRNAVMIVDGARPIVPHDDKAKENVRVATTTLMSAFAALPVTLSADQRNKINLDTPFSFKPDNGADPKQIWSVAVESSISGASYLDSGKKTEGADSTKIVVYGFSLVGPLSRPGTINQLLLPLTVAYLYEDKELVSIPNRDVGPKEFNLSRNPSAYLGLFAGLLPVCTALIGFFIWMRRRSA